MSFDLRTEALELIGRAAQTGITLRLFGGLAVQMLVANPLLARVPPGDIDCAGLSSELPALLDLFASHGYVEDLEVRRLFGTTRRLFKEPRKHVKLDLCLDVLLFARPIDFGQRLKARPFTLSVADLLLSKLQPREITSKDIIDTVNLLATFLPGIQETNAEFHLGWFVETCSTDWGLFQLVKENLGQVRNLAESLSGVEKENVKSRTRMILERLNDQPKSLQWRLRSIVGKRVQYWNEVGEQAYTDSPGV